MQVSSEVFHLPLSEESHEQLKWLLTSHYSCDFAITYHRASLLPAVNSDDLLLSLQIKSDFKAEKMILIQDRTNSIVTGLFINIKYALFF